MAHASAHVEEDDVLSLGSSGMLLTEGRPGKTRSQHGRETDTEVAPRGVNEKLTTTEFIGLLEFLEVHNFRGWGE